MLPVDPSVKFGMLPVDPPVKFGMVPDVWLLVSLYVDDVRVLPAIILGVGRAAGGWDRRQVVLVHGVHDLRRTQRPVLRHRVDLLVERRLLVTMVT